MNNNLPTDAFEWQKYLQEANQNFQQSTIELGKRLHEFKQSCDTKSGGSYFSSKVTEWLGYSQPVASKLIAIATDDRLILNENKLPASYNTLYELSKLSDDDFDTAVEEEKITPATTRKQAKELDTTKGVAPAPTHEINDVAPAPTPKTDVAPAPATPDEYDGISAKEWHDDYVSANKSHRKEVEKLEAEIESLRQRAKESAPAKVNNQDITFWSTKANNLEAENRKLADKVQEQFIIIQALEKAEPEVYSDEAESEKIQGNLADYLAKKTGHNSHELMRPIQQAREALGIKGQVTNARQDDRRQIVDYVLSHTKRRA